MKKLLIFAMVLTGIMLSACTSEDDAKNEPGSIYGIVTELGTAEPMKAVGVELYKNDANSSKYALLLKTVTFDDGHFEFKDLNPGNYLVKVVANGYEPAEKDVTVEADRMARIDLQIEELTTHMVVRTMEATIDGAKVTLNGEYTNETGYAPSEVGFVYSTRNNPIEEGKLLKCKVNSMFSTTLNDLSTGVYYFQAYAKNRGGMAYGEVRSFKICVLPVVTTLPPTNVLSETATLNGRIEEEGDPSYTERGFVYSMSFPYPTVDDPSNATTKVSISGRSKDFSANISLLTEGAKYYVRAYASNAENTVYGEVKTFVPTSTLPSVTTLDVTNILQTSATLNGRIDNAGEPAYTERGFVYSASYKIPAIGDPNSATTKVKVDGTSKEFSASASSLREGTTYYVRAYAISSKGITYGECLSFKTADILQYVIVENIAVQKQDLGCTNWNSAKTMCEGSRVNGFSDWRLPTIAELAMIYTHRDEIGGFNNHIYWSSTFSYSSYATSSYYYYCYNFTSGSIQDNYDKSVQLYVRAVRTIK